MRIRWLQRLCAVTGSSIVDEDAAPPSGRPSLPQVEPHPGRHRRWKALCQEATPSGHPEPAPAERIQSPVHCQPQASQHPETPQPRPECPHQPRMELVSDLSSSPHAQPGLLHGHGSCNVYVELVNNSPHCLTAFMLDPKDPLRCQVLQSPLSIRYYGNAQARHCSAAPAAAAAHGPLGQAWPSCRDEAGLSGPPPDSGATFSDEGAEGLRAQHRQPLIALPLEGSLHMALLRDLFQLEGEAVLQEMLSAVLAADAAGEGHEHAPVDSGSTCAELSPAPPGLSGGTAAAGAGSQWQHPPVHDGSSCSSPKPGRGWRRVLQVPMNCQPTHATQHEGRGAYSPTCHGAPHNGCAGYADTVVVIADAIHAAAPDPGCQSSSSLNSKSKYTPAPESNGAATSPCERDSPALPAPAADPSAQPSPPGHSPVAGAGAPAAPLLSSAASRDAADRERYLQVQGRGAIGGSGQQLLHLLMSTNPNTKQSASARDASDTGDAGSCNDAHPPPHFEACSVATDSGGMLSSTPPSNSLNVDDSRSGVRDLEDPPLLLLPPGVASPGASCAQAGAPELKVAGLVGRRCSTWCNLEQGVQLSPAAAMASWGTSIEGPSQEAKLCLHSTACGCSGTAGAITAPSLPCSKSVPPPDRPTSCTAAPGMPAGPPATPAGSSTGAAAVLPWLKVPLAVPPSHNLVRRSILTAQLDPTAGPAPPPAVSRGSPSPSHSPSPTSMYSSKMKAMLDLSASSMGYQLDLAALRGSVRGGASRCSIDLSQSSQLSGSCPRATVLLRHLEQEEQEQEQEAGRASLGRAWSMQGSGAALQLPPPRFDLLSASSGSSVHSNSCQSVLSGPRLTRVYRAAASGTPRVSRASSRFDRSESIPENVLQTPDPEPSAGSFGSRFLVVNSRDTLDIHMDEGRVGGGWRADHVPYQAAGAGAIAAAAGAGMGCILAAGGGNSCGAAGPALQLRAASASSGSEPLDSESSERLAAALPPAPNTHMHEGLQPPRDGCQCSPRAPACAAEVDAADCRWHDVYVTTARDPSGGLLLLMYQTDVTARTGIEDAMAQLNESQLNTLSQMFPRHVVEFLSTGGDTSRPGNVGHLARSHRDVSILFMDIVGFTTMSDQVEPAAVMAFLNELFSIFDSLCAKHKVHKLETAGDCYIVSSGILSVDNEGFNQVQEQHNPADSVGRVFAFAKDMLRCSREVLMPHNGSPVSIRVGINSGPCVSGMVGSKLPKFGIFGDTMNTAARMESTCAPGHIQISAASHSLLMTSTLSSSHEWQATNGIEVKGKGTMNTFIWRE